MEPVWTTPINWPNAMLVDDTDLDEQVSQNMVYLHGPRGQYPTQVDVVSSTTETNVLSHTVNADDLGTNRLLRATIIGDWLNNTAGAANLTVRVKFGGTTLWQDTLSVAQAGNRAPFIIELWLGMANSASAQFLFGHIRSAGRNATPAVGRGYFGDDQGSVFATLGSNGTAAINTTSNQAFVVSAEWGTANSLISFRKHYALVELI